MSDNELQFYCITPRHAAILSQHCLRCFFGQKIRIFARGTTAFLLLSNMDGISTMSVVE